MKGYLHNALIIILMLPLAAWSAQPRNPQPTTPDQVYQNDLDLLDAIQRARRPTAYSKAEFSSLTPTRAGDLYYCTDCTTDGLVVSTGTTRGAFGRGTARTTAIN